MFKGKKGQVILISAMLGFLAYLAVVQFIAPLKDFTQDTRSVSGLDCGNASVSTGVKATCVVVDWTLFGYVGAVIFVAIGIGAGSLFRKTKTS